MTQNEATQQELANLLVSYQSALVNLQYKHEREADPAKKEELAKNIEVLESEIQKLSTKLPDFSQGITEDQKKVIGIFQHRLEKLNKLPNAEEYLKELLAPLAYVDELESVSLLKGKNTNNDIVFMLELHMQDAPNDRISLYSNPGVIILNLLQQIQDLQNGNSQSFGDQNPSENSDDTGSLE